jgi:hypothetical protein
MLYTISLYLHITGALVLFSAIGIEWMCLTNLRKCESRENIRTWLNHSSVLRKFFSTAFFLLLIPGLYMMFDIWQNAAFAIIGIIGLLVLSISGGAVSGKRLAAIGKAAAKSEAESPTFELLLKVKDKFFWNSFLIRTCVALGIVFLMTVKTDFTNSLIVISISIVLGYLAAKISNPSEAVQRAEIKEENVLQ